MAIDRMLESPQDESVVRWGNEGDSFVVLEVRIPRMLLRVGFADDSADRMKNSRSISCPSTSNTATSPASCVSSTNTISTKSDITMKRAACLPMALVYVAHNHNNVVENGRTDSSIGVGIQAPRLQSQQQGCAGQHPPKSTCAAQAQCHDGRHDANSADGPIQHTACRNTAAITIYARAL